MTDSVPEKLGKYKEAAEIADGAGNKELATRLYELALKEKGIRNSEADWIKTTLQRLRKEREKLSAIRPAQPEDYMQDNTKKSGGATVQYDSAGTCPQCSAGFFIIKKVDKAYSHWKNTSFAERSNLMQNVANELRTNVNEYAEIMTSMRKNTRKNGS